MVIIADTPGRYNLTIIKGGDLDRTWTVRDTAGALVNLTGYTARMMVRSPNHDGAVVISLTDGGAANGITLGGSAGTVRIQRTAAMTSAYTFLRGVFDIEVVDAGGLVTRILEGDVLASPEVTR